MQRSLRAFALTLAAGTVFMTVPAAQAVQTSTFGLQAQGNRPALSYEADGTERHDQVVVYNRTNKPLHISLNVVGASRDSEGTFQYGGNSQGLARYVHVNTGTVDLAPKQNKTLNVTINAPASTSLRYAAITASGTQIDAAGPLAVQERLAVLVQLKPTDSSNPLLRTTQRKVASGIAASLIALTAGGLFYSRRKRATLS